MELADFITRGKEKIMAALQAQTDYTKGLKVRKGDIALGFSIEGQEISVTVAAEEVAGLETIVSTSPKVATKWKKAGDEFRYKKEDFYLRFEQQEGTQVAKIGYIHNRREKVTKKIYLLQVGKLLDELAYVASLGTSSLSTQAKAQRTKDTAIMPAPDLTAGLAHYKSPEELIAAIDSGKYKFRGQAAVEIGGHTAFLWINHISGVKLQLQAESALKLPNGYNADGFKVMYANGKSTVRMQAKLGDDPTKAELKDAANKVFGFVKENLGS